MTKNIQREIWQDVNNFIACGFGSGASPIAPGTAGTVVAIPLYLCFAHLSVSYYIGVVVIAMLFGFWVCQQAATNFGVHDHGSIVWDEFVGFWITMIAAPVTWQSIFLGFVLFRLFDIWKPWPIRTIDKKVQGGVGIVLDDVLAGIYALIVMQIIIGIM